MEADISTQAVGLASSADFSILKFQLQLIKKHYRDHVTYSITNIFILIINLSPWIKGITTPLPFSAHHCKKSGESKLQNSNSCICLLVDFKKVPEFISNSVFKRKL